MHIGGTKGKERKGFVLFFLFLGQSQIQLPSFSPPAPPPCLSFAFGASCTWLLGIGGSQFCLGKDGMKHMSCPCPAGEVHRGWDPGSILGVSSGTSAPAPVSLWALWKSLRTWLPSVSCLQSTGLGAPGFLGAPILLELQREGTVLTSLV